MKRIMEFLGVNNVKSLTILTQTIMIGALWCIPLYLAFVASAEDSDYSTDFMMSDVAAVESGYVKDYGGFEGFKMVLTRYSDTIRIAVITQGGGRVICRVNCGESEEVKLLKDMGDGKFYGSVDSSVNDVTVTCNGHTVTSRYAADLKLSKEYISNWGAMPLMIPY